jgi:hypothetical protein
VRSESKQFGTANLTTTQFAAMRGMTLMGRILRAVPPGGEQSTGLVAAVIGDQALVLEMLANTFAVYQAPTDAEPKRRELNRAENIDLVFGSDVRALVDAVSWVMSVNFESFAAGGSPGASASPPPKA